MLLPVAFALVTLCLAHFGFGQEIQSLVLKNGLSSDYNPAVKNSHLCLENGGNNRVNLVVNNCNGQAFQNFEYNSNTGQLNLGPDKSRCVEAHPDNNAFVYLNGCDTKKPGQKWDFDADSKIVFRANRTLCLDMLMLPWPRGVTTRTCSNTALSQKWFRPRCAVGFQLNPNKFSCDLCAAGTFKNVTGNTNCLPCPSMNFSLTSTNRATCVACSTNIRNDCPVLKITPHSLNFLDVTWDENSSREIAVSALPTTPLPIFVQLEYDTNLYSLSTCSLTITDYGDYKITVTSKPWRIGVKFPNHCSHLKFRVFHIPFNPNESPNGVTGCYERTQLAVIARNFFEHRYCASAGDPHYYTFDGDRFDVSAATDNAHYVLKTEETTVVAYTYQCNSQSPRALYCNLRIGVRHYDSYYTVSLNTSQARIRYSKNPIGEVTLINPNGNFININNRTNWDRVNDCVGSVSVTVTLSDSSIVFVNANFWVGHSWYLDVAIYVPGTYYNRTSGLCRGIEATEARPGIDINRQMVIYRYTAPNADERDNYFNCTKPNSPIRCTNVTNSIPIQSCRAPAVPTNFCRIPRVTTSLRSSAAQLTSSASVRQSSSTVYQWGTTPVSSSVNWGFTSSSVDQRASSSAVNGQFTTSTSSSGNFALSSSSDTSKVLDWISTAGDYTSIYDSSTSTALYESSEFYTSTIGGRSNVSSTNPRETDNSDAPNKPNADERCGKCYKVEADRIIVRGMSNSEKRSATTENGVTIDGYCEKLFKDKKCPVATYAQVCTDGSDLDASAQAQFTMDKHVSECINFIAWELQSDQCSKTVFDMAENHGIRIIEIDCPVNGTRGFVSAVSTLVKRTSTIVDGPIVQTIETDDTIYFAYSYGGAAAMVGVGAAVGGIFALMKNQKKRRALKGGSTALYQNPLFEDGGQFKDSKLYSSDDDADVENKRHSRRFSND